MNRTIHRGGGAGPELFVAVVVLALLAQPSVVRCAAELLAGEEPVLASLARTVLSPGDRTSVEARLEEGGLVERAALEHWAPVVDRWLRRGNAKVLHGREAWLVYRQGLDFVTAPDFSSPRARRVLGLPSGGLRPLDAILDFHRQLRERDIDLLVVPLPTKATLHPDALDPGLPLDLAPRNPGVRPFFEALSEAGVATLDVVPGLIELRREGRPAFLERDTHWTPEAMERVARQVAERVRPLAGGAAVVAASSPFDRRHLSFEGIGDVTSMLPWALDSGRWRPHRLELTQVAGSRDGRPPIDPSSPILVLGDSFTQVFSDPMLGMGRGAGFAEHLAAALEHPVDVIASRGGGANASRRALALRPRPLAGKRVVVWELTVRDLLFAPDGWQRVEIPQDAAASGSEVEPGGVFEVLARVGAVTQLPEESDYADCLAIVRYRLVEGILPGLDDSAEKDFFVARWGFRDFERTAVADLRVRQLEFLRLTRLPRDLSLENTCWMDSVGLDVTPWFALEEEGP